MAVNKRLPAWLPVGLLLVMLCVAGAARALDVIVNQQVAVSSLSQFELRRLFTMRQRQWPDGRPVTVFVLPEQHPVHVRFCKDMLNLFPYQLTRIWNKLSFSGTGEAPVVVPDQVTLLQRLSQTPGAIGYVDTDIMPVMLPASVKRVDYENH